MHSLCRQTLLVLLLLCLVFPKMAVCAEINIRIAAPDAVLDSMRQDITYKTSLGSEWQLAIGYSQRFAKHRTYSGLNQAHISRSWDLPGPSATLTLLAGKAVNNWSLWGGDSVVLSDFAPGINQIQYIYRNGPVTLEKVIGQLSGKDRYLLAHRLTLQAGYLTGSLGETVVCNGQFAKNLVSFMPWPYYWTQWIGLDAGFTRNNDVNAFAFVQGELATPSGISLGGEVMVDDMPHWFSQIGAQLFQVAILLHAQAPLGEGQLAMQYARVNNFTYSFQVDAGDYQHHNYILGYPLGPDVDELRLHFSFARSYLGINGTGLVIRRQGEGRMGDIWERAGYDESVKKAFLAGVVEHSQLIYATAEYSLWQGAHMQVRFGFGPVQNAKNKPGYNKVAPDGLLFINWQF